jgi:hypothetical protein
MVHPLVARPLREKISELIGDIPALLVHEYLDLDAVMPPERLRWSRTLGRPFMSGAEPDDNIIGPVWITEVLEHEDARVGGNCVDRDNLLFICRPVRKLQPHQRSVDAFWGVYLYSDDDREFNTKWEEKHGHRWPFIAGGVHPALRRLCHQYRQFEREWALHADESDMGFHDYLYQQRMEDIDMILMEAGETGDLRGVIDRFPMTFL